MGERGFGVLRDPRRAQVVSEARVVSSSGKRWKSRGRSPWRAGLRWRDRSTGRVARAISLTGGSGDPPGADEMRAPVAVEDRVVHHAVGGGGDHGRRARG